MSKPLIFIIVLSGVALFGSLAFRYMKARSVAGEDDYPYIYNVANFASEKDIRDLEELVRACGERFLTSINIVSTNKAGATTKDGSYTTKSGRSYTFTRDDTGWKIDAVEAWKN